MAYDIYMANEKAKRKRARTIKSNTKGKRRSTSKGKVSTLWADLSATEVKSTLKGVIEQWPAHMNKFSSFQGWHGVVRRVYLGNHKCKDVPVEHQNVCLDALRLITAGGLDVWYLVMRISRVQERTSAGKSMFVKDALRRASASKQPDDVKIELVNKLNLEALYTKKNLGYITDQNDMSFTVRYKQTLLFFLSIYVQGCDCSFFFPSLSLSPISRPTHQTVLKMSTLTCDKRLVDRSTGSDTWFFGSAIMLSSPRCGHQPSEGLLHSAWKK